jgi:2-hydroxychromene-2-carboxylate isomerase
VSSARARRPAIKESLKLETEKAIRAGVFGGPTVLVGER